MEKNSLIPRKVRRKQRKRLTKRNNLKNDGTKNEV